MPAFGNRSETGIMADPIIPNACSIPCICKTFTKASSVVIFMAHTFPCNSENFVFQRIPAIHGALAYAPEWRQHAVARQLGGEDRQVQALFATSHELRDAASGLGRIHNAVAAIAHSIIDFLC